MFLLVYCYIILELVASFKFVTKQLSDLAFNDCPEVVVIVGDFSKGLGATCVAKATIDLSLTNITEEALVCPLERNKELLEVAKVIINKASRKL